MCPISPSHAGAQKQVEFHLLFYLQSAPARLRIAGGMAQEVRLPMQGEGYCECGCGERTPIATQTRRDCGHIKGQPIRFINGHNRRSDPIARFWSCVDKAGPNGCWLWTGTTHAAAPWDYGRFTVRHGSEVPAHRFAWELLRGPIPEGLVIDHLCRVSRCVNPDHLEPVTQRENLLRGTGPSARHAATTHCPQGHPYDAENTYRDRRGGRHCRICRYARNHPT